jgi:cytochrome oxidase Cu insertion factor (SCO1/SenC/PrrC family)
MTGDTNGDVGGSLVPYTLALLVAFGMTYGGWKLWQVRQAEVHRGQAIPVGTVGPPLKEFELTERSGATFRTSDMRGRVWVATYFFTTCPGSCIRLNHNIQLLHNLPELKEVTWVSITCDPDTDTLEALRNYADQMKADPKRWLFCRGDLNYTKQVALGMDLYLAMKTHHDEAVVVDKAGKIRGLFDATSSNECDRMRSLLLECLAEDPPAGLAAGGPQAKESS